MPRHANTPDPRGAYQRGRILAATAGEALTAQQLADRLHLTRDGINIHLKAMKEATPRLIYVASFVYNPKGGRPAPQYRAGNHPDAEYVASRAPKRHLQVDHNKERITALLRAKPRTIMQLSDSLHLSHQWTRTLLRELRAARQVRIAGWQRQTAGIAPLYGLGSQPDMPKPEIDPSEAYQRLMKRIKRDPDAAERYQLTQKRRALKERIKRTAPQPWFAALMT